VPVVAAIHGMCLGGGYEVCLAASHRVCSMSSKTAVGLPESKLGLLPGCGGCTRLPRLIGLENSLQLILQGTQVQANKALHYGMVDKLLPYEEVNLPKTQPKDENTRPLTEDVEFFQRSFSFTQELANQTALERERLVSEAMNGMAGRKTKLLFTQEPSFQLEKYKRRVISYTEMFKDNPIGRLLIEYMTNNSIQRQIKGQPYKSPLKILDTIMNGYTRSVDDALEIEANNFADLVVDPVSKNLIALFQMIEATKKVENFCDPAYCKVKSRDVFKRIGVVGAGTMGSGIAQLCLFKGYKVYLKEVDIHYLEKGIKRIRNELFGKLVESGKISDQERLRFLEKLESGLEYEPLEHCQIVIEAALERVDIKKEVLEKAQSLNKDIIFATNTSSIPITSIAEESAYKQNVVGLHFFNPVHRMPLIEIITTPYTSQEALARVYQ